MIQRTWTQLRSWLHRLPPDAQAYLLLAAEGQPKSELLAMAKESSKLSPKLGLEQTMTSASIGAAAPTADALDGTAEPETSTETAPAVAEQHATTFLEALSSYGTQQSFVVVEGEEDLRRLLDAPLEQWRVFLHASQRGYVERNYHGPFRLTGGAGTGKTVVAMHRAKRMAAQLLVSGSRQRVLFTTYSANLATDIQANLNLICTADEMGMIDVINLDKFVGNFLRDKRYGYRIWYEGDSQHNIRDVWDQAIQEAGGDATRGLNARFFADEWEQVIVPQQVRTATDYLHVMRRGRGTKLGRDQKLAVWKVINRYQQLMKECQACDIDMAMSMVASLLREDTSRPKQYAHVIVDEGQDFSTPAYRVLRALVDEHDNDIFIVGDSQQRIYRRTVVLSKCGINISGRARRLKINYRTTEEIRAAADRIFTAKTDGFVDSLFDAVCINPGTGSQVVSCDDLDGGTEASGDSRSLVNGPLPTVRRFATSQEERDFVEQWIADRCGNPHRTVGDGDSDAGDSMADPRGICVVARTRTLVNGWVSALDRDLPYGVYKLGADEEDREHHGIRVATMHRVKGLEFDYVIVADVDSASCPPKPAVDAVSDKVALDALYKQEQSLIYVALTRARKEVLLLGTTGGISATRR